MRKISEIFIQDKRCRRRY